MISRLFLFFFFLFGFSEITLAYDIKCRILESNKLKVCVIEDHSAPVVRHDIWYKAGAADDFVRESGIAHFLEHVSFLNVDGIPGKFSKKVYDMGIYDNAMTSLTFTAYYMRALKEQLSTIMDFEAKRMKGVRFDSPIDGDEDLIEIERKIVIEERKMRVESSIFGKGEEELLSAMYNNCTNGGIPVLGWMDEIKAIRNSSLAKFYKKYYCPNNATVIVTGDTNIDEVYKLAKKNYGNIPMCNIGDITHRAACPLNSAMLTVKLSLPNVSDNMVVRSYRSKTTNSLEVEFISRILGKDKTGKLHKYFVDDKKLALAASVFMRPDISYHDDQFVIIISPKEGVEISVIEEALDEFIAGLLKSGLSSDDVDRYREDHIAEHIYDMEDDFIFYAGSMLTLNRPVMSIKEFSEYVSKLEHDDLTSVMQELFNQNFVKGHLVKPGDCKKEGAC